MSSFSFLSVYLSGVSVILLLTVSEAQYYEDYTPTPDYDSDYNATFDYSFYSNVSTDELEKFLTGDKGFVTPEEPEDGEGEEVTVTMATTQETTKSGGVDVYNAASLPVHLNFTTLVWTLVILISLNIQQLQHTL
ncbi:hypothetical protein PAMA_012009 [Pampus argenteus]